MQLITQIIKDKFERIFFIYDLLGSLKGMFWLSVFLMFLATIWEGVILTAMATFLQSLVDTTKFSTSTFEAGSFIAAIYDYFKQIPEDYRLVVGFIFSAMTILMGNIINAGLHTFQSGFSTRFIINVRCKIFNRLYRSPMTYFDNHKKGALITMVVNESRSCYNVLKSSLQLLIAFFRTSILLLCMLMISFELTCLIVVFSAVFLLETVFISRILKRLSVVVVERTRALTVDADESIQGVKLVKLFNLYDMMENSFRNNCSRADFTNRKQNIISQWQGAISQIIMLMSVFALIYINMTYSIVAISLMITFLYTLQKLTESLKMVNQSYGFFNSEIPRLDRIIDFMRKGEVYTEKSGEKVCDFLLKDRISFSGVYLSYGSEDVLKNIDLNVLKGQIVALVGESGSGKTSLANLLVRLYDVSKGAILIDGLNIREFDLAFLRARIGLVNQDSVLFNKTVRENIIIGREDATENEMIQAAKNAHVHEFVIGMPDGYNTLVGDRGVKLSGGQRQRINIAQIFLKLPEIMILDEATSALDTMSEQYIQESINKISKGCTSIIIAHRLSTVRHADKVVALDNGKIIEEGDWETLMNSKGLFYDMVMRQFFSKQSDLDKDI